MRHAGKGPHGEVIVDRERLGEVARVARQAGRELPPGKAFWRQQAERALMNHMFRKAALPPGNRLAVDRVSDEAVLLAREWRDD